MSPSNLTILLAHGAGAPSTSAWMVAWSERLRTIGAVHAFDYPYMAEGRRRPDPLPRLIEAHRAALAELHARFPDRGGVVLVGKSMGSRVGCHLSLEEPVSAVVCLGYPLLSVGDLAKRRDAVLLEMQTPVLFVQGTRDRLCPLDQLAEVRDRMRAPSELHVVEEGDHSGEITKRHTKATGITQEASDSAALAAIRSFLQHHA